MTIRVFSVADIERISNERNDKGWADFQEKRFVPLEDHEKEIQRIKEEYNEIIADLKDKHHIY